MSLRANPHLALAALALIVVVVFVVGLFTPWLGPYSDPLHLVILSSVLFFTLLVWFQTFGRRRRLSGS